MDALSHFCRNPTELHFRKIPVVVKTALYHHAKAIIAGRVPNGNLPLAKKVVEDYERYRKLLSFPVAPGWRSSALEVSTGFVMDTLPVSTLLFRGQKTRTPLPPKATYFALEIGNANQYLPTLKKGVLTIYKTTRPLRLFRLDSLDNINKLLKQTYTQDKPLYELVCSLFLGKVLRIKIDTDPTWHSKILARQDPIQFKRLVRNSIIKEDFRFSNWLCHQGYHGYSAGILCMYETGRLQENFPEEIMLCDPTVVGLEVVQTLERKKQKNRFFLDAILETL